MPAMTSCMAGAMSSHMSDKMMHVLPCGNSSALWHVIHALFGVYAGVILFPA